jgi:hypothetical protein
MRGITLLVYYGKYRPACFMSSGINGYAVIGTMIMIPGFAGGFSAEENPANFVFPLFRDKGGIFENS